MDLIFSKSYISDLLTLLPAQRKYSGVHRPEPTAGSQGDPSLRKHLHSSILRRWGRSYFKNQHYAHRRNAWPGQKQDVHVSPVGVRSIPTVLATGVLLGKAIKRLVGGDVAGGAGDVVEDKVDALAARIDVVDVLAGREGAGVGPVIGDLLQGSNDSRVVGGPGRAAGIAAC